MSLSHNERIAIGGGQTPCIGKTSDVSSQQSEENIHFSWRQLDTVYERIIGILQNTYIDNGSIHKQHIEQQTYQYSILSKHDRKQPHHSNSDQQQHIGVSRAINFKLQNSVTDTKEISPKKNSSLLKWDPRRRIAVKQ